MISDVRWESLIQKNDKNKCTTAASAATPTIATRKTDHHRTNVSRHHTCNTCDKLKSSEKDTNQCRNSYEKNEKIKKSHTIYHSNKFALDELNCSKWIMPSLRPAIVQQLIAWCLVLNLVVVCNSVVVDSSVNLKEGDDSVGSDGGHFTAEWAAHIPGGDHVAQQVAMDHGYVILEKVSVLFESLICQ